MRRERGGSPGAPGGARRRRRALRPFLRAPGSRPCRGRRSRWKRWLPAAACASILALAPALARSQEADTVIVSWTAPGDDGEVGTAAAYDLRVSESPITDASFSAAVVVGGPPAPARGGTRQRVVVRGLNRGTTYYFAIRTRDEAGNWSGLSNVARWDWILDAAPPAAPSGLSARLEEGGVRVRWEANAEPDLRGYTVYRAVGPGGPYAPLNGSPIHGTEHLDAAVPSDAASVWYRVTASDASGNESAASAAVSLRLRVPSAESVIEPGYPNPSRGSTPVTIPVVIAGDGAAGAWIDVVDSGGRRVRRIEIPDAAPGRKEVVWDGRNDAGREVAPGVYRGWLIAGAARSSVRLVRAP